MAMEIEARPSPTARRDTYRTMRVVTRWAVVAALVAVAMLLRHGLSANTDVSWLLTVGERVLDGQVLYRDVLETNPPKAVLVYLPGILLARTLGLSPEVVTDALVFAAIATSLGIVACLLKGTSAIPHRSAWPLICLSVIVLAILPMREFGQREHIAMLELLPALGVLALRLNRGTPPGWGIVVAGLGLGLSLAFKPYFALAVGGAIVGLAIRQKSWRLLLAPEHLIAAAIVAAYAVLVVIAFPDYLTIIGPLARDVYVPTGLSLAEMLQRPVVLPFAVAMLAACALMRRPPGDATLWLLVAMAIGFAAVFALQRKGWAYQAYPMLACTLLALGTAIARSDLSRMTAMAATLLLAAGIALSMTAFNAAFDAQALRPVIAQIGPHPKILAITSEPGLGHPLVRDLGGTWVSRQQGLWVTGYADYLRQQGALGPDRSEMLDRYAARERDWLLADIKATPPDVVLIDNLTGKWGQWVAADPGLSAVLAPYARQQTVNGIDILSKPQ